MKLPQNRVTGYTNLFSNLLTSQVSVNLIGKISRQESHICLSSGDKWADFFYSMCMLSSKIENVHCAEKTITTRCGITETATTRNVALAKQPQRETLPCGSYSEDSEGFGLKVACNL